MEAVLGEQMKVLVMSIKGNIDEEVGERLVEMLVEAIGMNTVPGKSMCKYPVNNKGGVGFTLFQPITESFIALDAWPEIGGAYLIICSCMKFSLRAVLDVTEKLSFEGKQLQVLRMGL